MRVAGSNPGSGRPNFLNTIFCINCSSTVLNTG